MIGITIYRSKNFYKIKGRAGEKKIQNHLSKLNKDEYIVMYDLTIQTERGKTTQIDHLVISRAGIFVIETKNYDGWILGNEKDPKWTQMIYTRKVRFYNPIWQNYGHIKAIEHLLNPQHVPVVSIVAFGSGSTLKMINVTSNNVHVLYFNDVIKCINTYKERVLSLTQMNAIYGIIKRANITDKKIKEKHIETIINSKKEAEFKVRNHICPRCNGKLVQRTGSRGTFLGCSNYPSCRYTA
nr:NERD domain-containing protein [Ectobacillus panaciterrae]